MQPRQRLAWLGDLGKLPRSPGGCVRSKPCPRPVKLSESKKGGISSGCWRSGEGGSEPAVVPLTPDEFKYLDVIPATPAPGSTVPGPIVGDLDTGQQQDESDISSENGGPCSGRLEGAAATCWSKKKRSDSVSSAHSSRADQGLCEHGLSPGSAGARRAPSDPDDSQPPATPAKKLKPVPRIAPRSIEKVGRYMFRHGVRIGDYRVPRQRPNSSPAESLSYQCRDGFDGHETSLGSPQPWTKRHGRGSTSSGSTPLTPRSAEIKTEVEDDGDEYHRWLMGNQSVKQIIRLVRTSNS